MTLWVVVGATGTGKSALSLELAEALGRAGRTAEIVNADAMQLYRGMDIGTAKLPMSERRGIPHHLFDVKDPAEEATVAWYQPVARAVIDDILGRGGDAILVGGSGLYISSVIFDFDFPPRDEALRKRLESAADHLGTGSLLGQLERIDQRVARAVDGNNPRRVIRALEVALLGGDAQVTLPDAPKLWLHDTRIIGVRVERAELVARIDARVHDMWAQGLLREVRGLMSRGLADGPTAGRAIGYAQAIAELGGELTREAAIEQTQQLTRRYARRQVSWFRRYPNVEWLRPGELPGIAERETVQ